MRNNKIHLQLSFEPNLRKIEMDRVQIAQVLVNLLRNAIDALGSTENEMRDINVITKLVDNNVEVRVKDNGLGIDPDFLGNIFKPFESTKSAGLGMGMGLSISRSIIEAHHGKIWADSKLHEGTCFHFTLPVVTS